MATTTVTDEPRPIPDAELVSSALGGQGSAFGGLYDRYAGLIRAICYDQTGDLAAGQDLAQDVFLRAHLRLASLRDRQRFAGWLVAIAKHRCREWRRQRTRDRHVLAGVAPPDVPVDAPPPGEDRHQELREAMGLLPERERLALHAFYLLGRSADQARGAVGLSRSGFYKLLQRAKDRLRRLMNERGRCSHE